MKVERKVVPMEEEARRGVLIGGQGRTGRPPKKLKWKGLTEGQGWSIGGRSLLLIGGEVASKVLGMREEE